MKRISSAPTLLLLSLLAMAVCIPPAVAQTAGRSDPASTAEGLVRSIYASVSFESGGPLPDWDHVRSLFLPQAVIQLRVTRDSSAIFSVGAFIDDFVRFIERSPAKTQGFTEKVLLLRATVFRDIAHVLVLYEAHITGSARPPQRGVDSWHLVQREGRWWIVSVLNDIPTPNDPLPEALSE